MSEPLTDGYGISLFPQHARVLVESAISPKVAQARGYVSVDNKKQLERAGFTPSQQRPPGLLIPVWDVSGNVALHQFRSDNPRTTQAGKKVKYETPTGARMEVDCPPGARDRIGSPDVPLFITEGVRKADAAVTAGLCCVALLGVWNWRGTNEQGGSTALGAWDSIHLKGRPVYIAFDSDVMTKTAVHNALGRLGNFLHGRGAVVAYIYLDPKVDGSKVGLDDYFAAGGDVGGLVRAGRSELLAPVTDEPVVQQIPMNDPSDSPAPEPSAVKIGDVTIVDVVRDMRAYHHMPDVRHVLFALAVAVTDALDGEPLWGMLVGAPSSGKTEAIRLTDDVATERADDLTEAALLSWTQGKNPRPTGILLRIGPRGFLTFGDFSTVLASSDRGSRDKLFAALRRVYDGHYHRELGQTTMPLEWDGRLTFLAAVTPAIDHYSSHTDALGPRWLYWRLADASPEEKRQRAQTARAAGNIRERRAATRQTATALIRAAQRKVGSVELSEELTGLVLDNAAILVCYGRAAVPRDGYGKREINGIPVIEEPPRLMNQMCALAKGLIALGLDEDSAAGLCQRAALDSMPQPRRIVLEQLSYGEKLTVSEIARRTRLDRKVARFALEELRAVGVTACLADHEDEGDEESIASTKPREWVLTGELGDLAAEVLADCRKRAVSWAKTWDELWGPTPQPPSNGGLGLFWEIGSPRPESGSASHGSSQVGQAA